MEAKQMEQKGKSVSPFSSESRNAYVIEHLTEAMLTLLAEKPISEITISELCDSAGVGRTSFYRNFESKEDILKAHMARLFQGCVAGWDRDHPASFSGVIRQLFFHFEANRRFYSLIYERGLIDLVKDLFLETFGFNPAQDLVPAYSSAYVAFLLYGWVEVWFRRGMKETVAELADCLGKSVDSAMKAQSKRQEQV